MVGKDTGTLLALAGIAKQMMKIVTVEDVIPENQCHRLPANELLPNEERLGYAAGFGLHRVRNRNAPLAAVSQQFSESRLILRRRDHEDVPDAR